MFLKQGVKCRYSKTCGDKEDVIKLKRFDEMFDTQWANVVGRLASHSKKVGGIMKPPKIPLKSDIIKLSNYIVSQYRRLLAELTSSINRFTAYDELTDFLVAYIID